MPLVLRSYYVCLALCFKHKNKLNSSVEEYEIVLIPHFHVASVVSGNRVSEPILSSCYKYKRITINNQFHIFNLLLYDDAVIQFTNSIMDDG